MAEPKAAKSKSSSKPSKKHHDEAASKKATKPKAAPAPSLDAHFKPCADVTGLRFGAQLVTRALTVRRAGPLELPHLLRVSPDSGGGEKQSQNNQTLSFAPTTTAYIPTSFTILAHHAWHTLTLGLGTRRLLRAAPGSPEMARFKFRKGCVTFYVYAVRAAGARGFARADELRAVVEAVAGLKDFLDHTAMLALPGQRSIDAAPSPAPAPAGVVH